MTAKMTTSSKRVGFSGEFPELTSEGRRVPEMVMESEGLISLVSGLTPQLKSGGSTVSSLSFVGITEDGIERFFDRLLLTCRVSVCPLKGSEKS
jgi:hypothetical protein